MTQSYLETSFELMLKHHGIGGYEREYQFDPPRQWRFDFAWLRAFVAVEVEGLVHEGGRHQRVKGFMDDAEKYEAALVGGWRVYRVPGPWVATPKRHVWRAEMVEALRVLIGEGKA